MNKSNITSASSIEGIPLSAPEIRGNEWKYIKECLDTNWVSSVGKYVERFEHSISSYLDRQQAVACVNGTAALHIALLVSGVQPESEVLLPALTFVAPANAVRYVGAWPVFIDVQPDTYQLDPEKVHDFLTQECDYRKGHLVNRITGRTISAVMPVHILGHPVDMEPILELARRFELIAIEDAAESLGARYKGRCVGTFGDIVCLSFNGNKIITTGGGGMLLTDNKKWADKARYLATQAKDDALEFIHNEIGYNYRLTNIQAAMGVAQMEHLDEYIACKKRIALRYNSGLSGIEGITLAPHAQWAEPIFWLYTILIDADRYGVSSRELLHKLKITNIQSRPLWHPLPTLPSFKKCFAYRIEVADKLYRDALNLPSSVGLKPQQQDKVIQVIKSNPRK